LKTRRIKLNGSKPYPDAQNIDPKIASHCRRFPFFFLSFFFLFLFSFFYHEHRPPKLIPWLLPPYAAATMGRCLAATATQMGRRLPRNGPPIPFPAKMESFSGKR
jgi:hypothetical protein